MAARSLRLAIPKFLFETGWTKLYNRVSISTFPGRVLDQEKFFSYFVSPAAADCNEFSRGHWGEWLKHRDGRKGA